MRRTLIALVMVVPLATPPARAEDSLCKKLGGGDAISTVVKSFLMKMRKDDPDKLGRFWLYGGDDGVQREEQLIVDFVQSATGCDRLYVGRNMTDAHKGMKLSKKDWERSVGFLRATLDEYKVPSALRDDVVALVDTTRSQIVECEANRFGCP